MKIIFHINALDKWPLVLSNAHNTVNEFEKIQEEQIIILVNGAAVQALKIGHELNLDVQGIINRKVTIEACNNALMNHKYTEDDLLAEVAIIPAGVIELSKRQYEGYAYIKP